MIRNVLVFLALFSATAAQAEWREATSRNFIVYSEGSEEQLRDFTEKLEKFHFVLRTMHQITRDPPPNRLKVYLMRNIEGVQRTLPGSPGGVAGYAEFNLRGPIMVGTRQRVRSESEGLDAEAILLHEYAHHFMFGYFPATYPTWYVEGFAEFWGQTEIGDDNVVRVGLPAGGRLYSFLGNRWMPLDRMLAARSYGDANASLDLIYSQGWLLVRYMFTNSERNAQLRTYLGLINQGRSYEEAMTQAFGEDARELDGELRNFSESRRFPVLDLPFRPIDVGPIEIRALRPAEDALVLHDIRLGRGVLASEALEFVASAREIAGRYPDDPAALAILVESERLAGNTAQAIAAVDRLLAVVPEHPRGLALKGLLTAEALRASASNDETAWDAARAPILRAHRLAQNDPMILQAYYEAYAAQGVLPPAGAQNGLFRALELVPGDDELRYRVAWDFEQRDMIPEAIAVIRPSALAMRDIGDESERERRRREEQEEEYRDAGTARHETAREMLARLQARLAATDGGASAGEGNN